MPGTDDWQSLLGQQFGGLQLGPGSNAGDRRSSVRTPRCGPKLQLGPGSNAGDSGYKRFNPRAGLQQLQLGPGSNAGDSFFGFCSQAWGLIQLQLGPGSNAGDSRRVDGPRRRDRRFNWAPAVMPGTAARA